MARKQHKPAPVGSPAWRLAYEAGVWRAKSLSQAREARRAALAAHHERLRLVALMAELPYWWDGPGSEGRCV